MAVKILIKNLEVEIKLQEKPDENEGIHKTMFIKLGEHRFWRLDNWL